MQIYDRNGRVLWSGDVRLPEIEYTLEPRGQSGAWLESMWRRLAPGHTPSPPTVDIARMLLGWRYGDD